MYMLNTISRLVKNLTLKIGMHFRDSEIASNLEIVHIPKLCGTYIYNVYIYIYTVYIMYCVNGASRSSLLIEFTDSMIYETYIVTVNIYVYIYIYIHRISSNRPRAYYLFQRSYWCVD